MAVNKDSIPRLKRLWRPDVLAIERENDFEFQKV